MVSIPKNKEQKKKTPNTRRERGAKFGTTFRTKSLTMPHMRSAKCSDLKILDTTVHKGAEIWEGDEHRNNLILRPQ